MSAFFVIENDFNASPGVQWSSGINTKLPFRRH